MKIFIKANTAAAVASFYDYLVAIILKEIVALNPVWASILGTVTGGIINFFICRHWVFKVKNASVFYQTKRYFIIWVGNLLLNGLGVYFLIDFAGLNYLIAKILTSVTEALAYNYPLQKNYVFKNS